MKRYFYSAVMLICSSNSSSLLLDVVLVLGKETAISNKPPVATTVVYKLFSLHKEKGSILRLSLSVVRTGNVQ